MSSSLSPAESLLVVINPASNTNIALDRAIITSKLRVPKPKLHLLFATDEESVDSKNTEDIIFRGQGWLRSIIQQLEEEHLEYSYEFCWSSQWCSAILNSAERYNPDLILIPDDKSSAKRGMFTNSKWALLRSSLCPVMIVRPDASSHRKKVLAAVNIQNETADYIELNEKILTKGLAIAQLYNAEFFVVNSYKDSMHYPNREKILQMTGLPSKNVHAGEGEPAEVISDYANRIEADIVIIGTKARRGALSIMRGNTSEKVLKMINQDVITYS